MHKCRGVGCQHDDHNIYVPSECSAVSPDILFIGLGPGVDEVSHFQGGRRQPRPFVGAAGYRFDTNLVQSGIRRARQWVTNAVKYWPPEHDPKNLENGLLKAGYDELAEEIRRFLDAGGTTVVPMGNEAIVGLLHSCEVVATPTGNPLRPKITKWRGSILRGTLEGREFKVIPTIHPSAILRTWDYNVLSQMDLRRIKEECGTRDLNLPKREISIPSDDDFDEWLRHLKHHVYEEPESPLACDIEVVGGQLFCVSYALDPSWAVVLDWETHKEDIIKLLETPNPKVWHNSMYDLTFLEARCGIEPKGYQHDTQLMWHSQQPELATASEAREGKKKLRVVAVGKGLNILASMFTREPYWKDERDNWKKVADIDRFLRYGGRDACVTIEVYNVLNPKLDKEEVRDVYEYEIKLVTPFKAATIRGIPIDTRSKGAMAGKTKRTLTKTVASLEEILGREINYNSPKQVLAALQGMGCDLASTDKSELQRALLKETQPDIAQYLRLLLEYRGLQKAHGTFYSFKYGSDRRVRSSWNISGAETGRLSSSKSIIFEGGLNVQTLPRDARRFFKPHDPEWCVGYFDLNKAELRIVSQLSGCDKLMEAIESTDMWAVVGEALGGEFEKTAVKNCVYGSIYGGGARTIANEMNGRAGEIIISEGEVRNVQNELFRAYPQLKDWQAAVKRNIARSATIRTLGQGFIPRGRKRHFRFRGRGVDPASHREALNYIPQGTVPDLISHATLELEGTEGYEFWGHIHDAILCALKIPLLAQSVPTVRDSLQRPLSCKDIRGRERTFTVPVDVHIGPSFGELEDYVENTTS